MAAELGLSDSQMLISAIDKYFHHAFQESHLLFKGIG